MLWRYRPSRNLPVTDAPEENRRPPGMDKATWRTTLDGRRRSATTDRRHSRWQDGRGVQ